MALLGLREVFAVSPQSGQKRTLMRSRGAFRSRCRPRARARREQDRGPRLRSGGRSAGRSRPRLRWRVSHLAWRVSGRGGGSSCWASRCSHRGAHAERCGTRRSRDGPTLDRRVRARAHCSTNVKQIAVQVVVTSQPVALKDHLPRFDRLRQDFTYWLLSTILMRNHKPLNFLYLCNR
jgi:hypothetical protein